MDSPGMDSQWYSCEGFEHLLVPYAAPYQASGPVPAANSRL
jgi:hypothetical protein